MTRMIADEENLTAFLRMVRGFPLRKTNRMRNTSDLVHEDLSREIIGAAMGVLNELGPGLGEKLYENALIIELAERGLCAEQQQEFAVQYKGHFIGKLIPDLVVNRLVIVDTKTVECFNDDHFAQVMGYLAITRLDSVCCSTAMEAGRAFGAVETARITWIRWDYFRRGRTVVAGACLLSSGFHQRESASSAAFAPMPDRR